MNIKEIIDLWNRSKHNTLMIRSLPCINDNGEVTYGTGIYTKGQIIMCGGEYNVEGYLMKIYENSIFMIDEGEGYLLFKMIIRGDKNERI